MGRLKIVVGNITSDEILAGHDLIINPTNPQMVAGAGVSFISTSAMSFFIVSMTSFAIFLCSKP